MDADAEHESALADVSAPESVPQHDGGGQLLPRTLLRFLAGDRQAILDIADSPRALWLGALLVLSAGLAREYDGEDLLAEPWHLLIPFGASLVTAGLLYLLVRGFGLRNGATPEVFRKGFRTFLSLYWMTAPLAWLYAIPFERWASSGDAMRLNLAMLGIVATWRVVLIIRVIVVAYGFRPALVASSLVLLFADAVMLAVVQTMPVPVLRIMGGVRLDESESVLLGTAFLLTIVGFLSGPVLLLIVLVAVCRQRDWLPVEIRKPLQIDRATWFVAVASILIWIPILPLTQPEQALRRQVEHDLRQNRIRHALLLMSRHGAEEFPPHWQPPPHISFERPTPDLTLVINELLEFPDDEVSSWVRDLYMRKLRDWLPDVFSYYGHPTPEKVETTVALLERLPVAEWYPGDDAYRADDIRGGLKRLASDDRGDISTELKDRMRKLIEAIEVATAETADAGEDA